MCTVRRTRATKRRPSTRAPPARPVRRLSRWCPDRDDAGMMSEGEMATEKVTLWLTPATMAALQAEAQRRAVKYSELTEELIARGLAEATATRLESRAGPG